MKASESLQNDQSAATENALRRAVDTTPAFIHAARPDGYLDYFNRGLLDFLGKSLEDVCGWRWTESVHPEAGICILMNPQSGVISLTFVFAIFFLVKGVIETVLYFQIGKVGNSGMGSINAYGTLSDSRRIVIESTR